VLQDVVEAHQCDDPDESCETADPRSRDEPVSRVLDVRDPLRAVCSRFRDQHLDAVRSHQRDAGDEAGDGDQGADGADGAQTQLSQDGNMIPREQITVNPPFRSRCLIAKRTTQTCAA
jgi:hypothetical protein